MADSKLNILVSVKDDASAALSRLSSDVGDLGGNLSFAADGAGALASAFAAVGATTAIEAAVQAFSDAEQTMNNFDAIIRSLPTGLQALRGEILKHAEDATYMGFSNEEAALSMAKLLKVLGNGPDTFKAFDAVMGVAIMHHEGLAEATREVIMGMDGMGKSFKEDGIVVDAHLTKQQNLANIYGVAKLALDNYRGSTLQATNELEQFANQAQQSLGGVFALAVKAVASSVESWVLAHGGINKVLEDFTPLIRVVAVLLGGVVVAGFTIAAVVAGAFLLSISPLVGAIALLMVALGAMGTAFVVNFTNIKNVGISAWEAMKTAWAAAVAWIETNVWTPFLSSIDKVTKKLQAVWDKMTEIASAIGGGISGAAGALDGAIGGLFGGHRAAGGPVSGGSTYLVGERGPELFTAGSSGLIHPSGSFGGGGMQIVINISGAIYSGAEAAEEMGNELARIIKNQLNLSGIHA